jgi:hypothetical protein
MCRRSSLGGPWCEATGMCDAYLVSRLRWSVAFSEDHTVAAFGLWKKPVERVVSVLAEPDFKDELFSLL